MFDQKSGLSQLPIMIDKQFKCLGDVPYMPEEEPVKSLFFSCHFTSMEIKTNRQLPSYCVVPEIIHTTPTEGHWKFLGGWGT